MQRDTFASPETRYRPLALTLFLSVAAVLVVIILIPVDANTKAVLATAAIAVAGWLFTSEFQRRENAKARLMEIELEHERRVSEIQLQTYESRRESYDEFLALFQEAQEAVKTGKELDISKVTIRMMRANLSILLLGSDEVIRLWDEFKKMGLKPPTEDKDVLLRRNVAILMFYSRVIIAIRRDLGREATVINEESVLRSFLTDYPKISDLVEEMRDVTSADEVS